MPAPKQAGYDAAVSMHRRKLLPLLAAGALLAGCARLDSPRTFARVGVLGPGPFDTPDVAALKQRLAELGWVEHENLSFAWRYTVDGTEPDLPRTVAELVRSIDVAVASHGPAALAINRADGAMPIVLVAHPDPVAGGLVASLDKPGGMITGNGTSASGSILSKRTEILKELLPGMTRLGVLLNPDFSVALTVQLPAVVFAAQQLGLDVVLGEARTEAELPAAFDALLRGRVDAVQVFGAPLINAQRVAIVAFLADARLPAMLPGTWVDVGGLMSHGNSTVAAMQQVAVYVDKILRGARPADLPIVQPSVFEFEVNVGTAEKLGIEFPASVAAQVTRWVT